MNFTDFFTTATGFQPYPYQVELADGRNLPALLRIPTGAGKTEAAVLGWFYRYFHHPEPQVRSATPRRLVYCLPMRTLVEQTQARVKKWLARLDRADDVAVVILMGGEPRAQWHLHPERAQIIIGTQDMLLSRALNRGYGNTPFMWPVEYGLLNNDCLWVMDEVQLMANGLPTSTQLAGLRRKLGTFGPAHSLWMSATVKPGWLDTIDHGAPPAAQVLELGPGDLESATLAERHHARKIVSEVPIENDRTYARTMAEHIADKHEPGTLTLAIVNTVERSQKIYEALNNPNRVSLEAETLLVHSRFRSQERDEKRDVLAQKIDESGPGKIVVATQAIEAGVDISARTLLTELAPWPSLVQRFGRCNRKGEDPQGDILWVDMGESSRDTAPYEPEDVEVARQRMKSLEGKSAGPADIEELGDVMEDADHLTVIRRRDVVGLFDTTPDLSGSYLDVSQYVRGMDERDVSVFWRELTAERPGKSDPKPTYFETVSVPCYGTLRDYLKDDKRRAWRWDYLDGQWLQVRPGDIHPGMILMLDAAQGGYSPDTGWDPSNWDAVEVIRDGDAQEPEEDQSSDPLSALSAGRKSVTLIDHTNHVVAEVDKILTALSGLFSDANIPEIVRVSARYHDAGKAHPAFQEMLRDEKSSPSDGVLMAKSSGNGRMDSSRRHFRHELGSALVLLKHADELGERECDLAAYLAASHHGKVRLGIRSFPGRRRDGGYTDSNPDPDYLLGYKVSKPEALPAVDLGGGVRTSETTLDLSIARIGLNRNGRRSWLERSLGLLEFLGPFKLAYLEAIMRAGDMRASKKEQEDTN